MPPQLPGWIKYSCRYAFTYIFVWEHMWRDCEISSTFEIAAVECGLLDFFSTARRVVVVVVVLVCRLRLCQRTTSEFLLIYRTGPAAAKYYNDIPANSQHWVSEARTFKEARFESPREAERNIKFAEHANNLHWNACAVARLETASTA